MLVNVNGQVCELVKAEAKGGNYHRRVPRKSGKGFNYYYDEDKYAASKNAHLDGPATRGARLAKAVLGAVDGAGKKGCSVKSLRAMAAKEGKEHVAKAIRGCLEKGDLTLKKGVLYRALKQAAKEERELEDKPKRKGKSMREEPGKRKIEKSGPGLYLDELRKAKGPIGIGKRGGKIYGYDKHGKPIYNPGDVPDKPKKAAKKKPSKPSPQLSLFGQTTLEKPKPKPEPKKVEKPPVEQPEPKKARVGEMRVRTSRSSFLTGSSSQFAVEVYDPKPGKFPWRTVEGGFGSYEQAVDRRKQLEAGGQPKPEPKVEPPPAPWKAKRKLLMDAPVGSLIKVYRGKYSQVWKKTGPDSVLLLTENERPVAPERATKMGTLKRLLPAITDEDTIFSVEEPGAPVEEKRTLVQKMVRVRELLESDYPNASQEQREDLYNKLVDAQAGRPGSDIDAAITEAEKLLAESQQSSHVVETPPETPATIEVEQAKHGEPVEAPAKPGQPAIVETIQDRAAKYRNVMDRYQAAQDIPAISAADLVQREKIRDELPPRFTPDEEAQAKEIFGKLPKSGEGWRTLYVPYGARYKLDANAVVNKIVALPEGTIFRVTRANGEYTDFQKDDFMSHIVKISALDALPAGVEKLQHRPGETVPILHGAVMAQIEVKTAPKVEALKPEATKESWETAWEGETWLPEVLPKPDKPPLIPRKEFGREMRRRWSEGLYSSKNTYAVKEEIKDVGGVWDRYNNTWLLPSQEALNYIESLIPHKEAQQHKETAKAVSEGLIVSGNTYAIRDKIKAAGGKWDGATKSWVMPNKEAVAKIEALMGEGGEKRVYSKKATPRQLEYASQLIQKVSLETWRKTEAYKKGFEGARMRALTSEMTGEQLSAFIADMLGEKPDMEYLPDEPYLSSRV